MKQSIILIICTFTSSTFRHLFPLILTGACFAQTVGPRQHFDPNSDQARNIGRLSFPSHDHELGLPKVHRLAPVSADELRHADRKDESLAIGRHREIVPAALTTGQWSKLPDGTLVWRLAIQSPSARALRLHFSNLQIGSGQLWVHDGSRDQSQVSGPYTQMGPYSDGDFWSDSIASETVIVEYQPGNKAASDKLPFDIHEISHVYSDSMMKASSVKAASATCNLDVTCYTDWAETAKAVARISFESGSGSYVCSGTLLNTRNNSDTLLFLTANHCIDSDAVARTLQAFWFYQTKSCNDTPPSARNLPMTSGARLLVTGDRGQGDFTLLRLNSVPSGVVFSGWDPQQVPEGKALTVIHHPAGDFKRIAFGNRVANSRTAENYYSVFYSQGLTEGGSSGSGLFSAPLVLTGTLSNGPKADTPEEYCRISPFADNYGRFSAYYPLIRDILEGRNVPAPPSPPSTSHELVSGVPASVSINSVSTTTLANGSGGYRIVVPPGATRLDIALTTNTPGADLDLYVRYNTDITLSSGVSVADHKSETAAGNEQITITATSTPPLRAGTYYIAFGVFTTGVNINATLTATVTTASAPPSPTAPIALTSGTARTFTIPAVSSATLASGGFTIEVPQGATRLDVKLSSSTANVDLDLFLRAGTQPTVSGGEVVYDYKSDGAAADESISVTSSSSPALRAGTYYIRIGVFTTGVTINATITATVTTASVPPPVTPIALTSGTARNFSISPVSDATLIAGGFTINVPAGATQLDVRLTSSTPNADLDLYVRYNTDVSLTGGRVDADYRSEGDTASESILVTSSSNPPLRAGTYYIRVAAFTTGVTINATITATFTTGNPPPPAGITILTSGRSQAFSKTAVGAGRLFNGSEGYTITVPQGATRLDIKLTTTTANVDIDLYARIGTDTTVSAGRVVADYRSEGPTGDEQITLTTTSNPPLRAGTYYISLLMINSVPPGGLSLTATGTLTATVSNSSTPGPATGPTVLVSGVRETYTLPAATQATLYNGSRGYVIDVPVNATRLDVQLTASTAGADVDLFIRRDSDPSATTGDIEADYSSTGPDGSERITITSASSPPLRAGRYYIAFGVYTTNTPVTGSLMAIITTGLGSNPAPTAATQLTSGVASKFSLPAVSSTTLYNGNYSFQITVPDGASSMRVQLISDNPSVDVDLYARYQGDTDVADGDVVADYSATSFTGNESLTITSASSPPIRPGTYYFSLLLFTKNAPSTGTIMVTVERGSLLPSTSSSRELTSGVPVSYTLPSVSSPTLFSGSSSFRIAVGPQHKRLAISIRGNPNVIDVDLLARFGQEPAVSNGLLVADFRSSGDNGDEDILIDRANLRSGVYFISLALYTTGRDAAGTIIATLSADSSADSVALLDQEKDLHDTGMAVFDKAPRRITTPILDKSMLANKRTALEDGIVKSGEMLKKHSQVERVSQ